MSFYINDHRETRHFLAVFDLPSVEAPLAIRCKNGASWAAMLGELGLAGVMGVKVTSWPCDWSESCVGVAES